MTFGRPLRPQAGDDPRLLAADLERAVAALADEQTTDWWTARKRAARHTTPSLTGPPSAGRGGGPGPWESGRREAGGAAGQTMAGGVAASWRIVGR